MIISYESEFLIDKYHHVNMIDKKTKSWNNHLKVKVLTFSLARKGLMDEDDYDKHDDEFPWMNLNENLKGRRENDNNMI